MKKIFSFRKKGFTLIELLAVIVILAIILLIVVPIVLNVIGDARKGAFESSARGLIKTVESEYMRNALNNNTESQTYVFNNGVQTEGDLKFSGKPPTSGCLHVTNDGRVALVIEDGGWLVTKGLGDKDITTVEYDEQDIEEMCNDIIGEEEIGELPETDDIAYIYDFENIGENATPCLVDELEFTHILDKRDDTTYAVTKIGEQCWLAENLAYTGNGCLFEDWEQHDEITNPIPSACDTHSTDWGTEVLYQWGAAMDGNTTYFDQGAQGLCPIGWHIPTDNEWTTLTNYVNSVPEYRCNDTDEWIGKAFASTNHWNSNSTECNVGNDPNTNNATGFSGLPASSRFFSGGLGNPNVHAWFWSSSSAGTSPTAPIYLRRLNSAEAEIRRNTIQRDNGQSVRCLLGP